MPTVRGTLSVVSRDGVSRYEYPEPVEVQVGISDSYILAPNNDGASIFDAQTLTQYIFEESYTLMQSRVTAALDVMLNDQTTPTVISRFALPVLNTTTTAGISIDDRVVPVADNTGIQVGHRFVIFNTDENIFDVVSVVAIDANNITVDCPIAFAFPPGSFVDVGDTDMAVDGSVTPVVFGLRGPDTGDNVALSADITRIIFHCTTSSAPKFSEFGDIVGGITNGLCLRRRNGFSSNIFNIKKNSELIGLCYDFDIFSASGAGADGFSARLTFAGQNKMGVTIRLEPGDDLEFIVQDDLTPLTSFHVTAEGHIVN